jgi:hypothetical protein
VADAEAAAQARHDGADQPVVLAQQRVEARAGIEGTGGSGRLGGVGGDGRQRRHGRRRAGPGGRGPQPWRSIDLNRGSHAPHGAPVTAITWARRLRPDVLEGYDPVPVR